MDNTIKIDYIQRIKGMLCGFMLGDALGAPHEFYKWNKDRIYTGKLELEPYRQKDARFCKPEDREVKQPIGSTTDDTCMTIALLKSILRNDGYNVNDVILAYQKWTHSGTTEIGKNTRYIFANKTVKGYQSRIAKRDEEIANGKMQISLSNGGLMRCSPIALLDDWEKVLIKDVSLTNPYIQTIETNKVYITILRALLNGYTINDIIKILQTIEITDNGVSDVINKIINPSYPSYKENMIINDKNKGWCLNALWCSLYALIFGKSYNEAIRWVITQDTKTGQGDTDTNAAIAGALLGAYYGFDKLMLDEDTKNNWDILLNTANNRLEPHALREFLPINFDDLINKIKTFINK